MDGPGTPVEVSSVDPDAIERAKWAVTAAFIGAGFAFSSWASRIPQVRDRLALDPGQLGIVLLCLAIGSLIALPLSSVAIGRFGEARTVFVTSLMGAAGLAVIGLGHGEGRGLVGGALVVMGFGFGMWDVAMNVQGAAVEQRLGRSILPRFHAGFSIGTVTGAGLGAAAVALGVSVGAHLVLVALLVAVAMPTASRSFITHAPEPEPVAAGETPRGSFAGWSEPRTLMIGLFVLCVAFSEGTGNDWLSVAVIDGYDASAAVGTATFAVFLTAMTVGRWFGPELIDQRGRVPVLRASAALAAVGLALLVYGGSMAVGVVGSALWGLGTSLGFPVGMSAAADDPAHAAQRVSVVSSIGYVAFLAGPPAIGLLGDHVGTLHSLSVALGLLALAAVISGATREPRT